MKCQDSFPLKKKKKNNNNKYFNILSTEVVIVALRVEYICVFTKTDKNKLHYFTTHEYQKPDVN